MGTTLFEKNSILWKERVLRSMHLSVIPCPPPFVCMSKARTVQQVLEGSLGEK